MKKKLCAIFVATLLVVGMSTSVMAGAGGGQGHPPPPIIPTSSPISVVAQ